MTIDAIKGKIGEEESKKLLRYVDERVTTQVATKKDLETVQKDLETVEERLRGEIKEVKADIIKWMFIFWVGQIGALLAILKLAGVF